MITTLLIHVFISTGCLLTGFLVYDLAGSRLNRPWLITLLTGLLTLAVFSQALSLFTPVNGISAGITLIAIFLLSIIRRKTLLPALRSFATNWKKPATWSVLLILSAWILILILNSGPVTMDDTHSYHIQMIKWANEYGTVPGIANLHERFGFNSSWFTLVSFFLYPAGPQEHFTALNGCLSYWFLLYCLQQSFSNKSASLNQISWFLLTALIVFCWPMVRGSATNTNYDFITTVCVFVLFVWSLEEKQYPGFEWFFWPLALFTIRIINYPLLLLSLWTFVQTLKERKWKTIGVYSFFSVLITGSFIARNIILSGYPFYPSTAFDWFKVDWKVDQAVISQLQDFIKYFNRVNVMYMNLDETRQLAFPAWTAKWFQYLFRYDKPVVIAAVLGLLLTLVRWKKFRQISSVSLRFFCFVMTCQLISWFWIAPDPRFAYGSLLIFIFLLLKGAEPVYQSLNNRLTTRLLMMGAVTGLVLLSVLKCREPEFRNWIVPASLPKPPVSIIQVGSVRMNIPEKILNNWNPRCYNTPLPCLYMVDPRLECRGDRIEDGFRLAK